MTTFEKVMERFRMNEDRVKHTIVQFPYTIEQERENIQRLVRLKPTVNFLDLFSNCQSKMHACFTFLALLDLIQAKLVHIFIEEGFNSFYISDVTVNPLNAN
jgi:segregation and condensation protein A